MPSSAVVGTSFNCSSRCADVTAMPCSAPDWTCVIAFVIWSHSRSTCPPSRSVIAGAELAVAADAAVGKVRFRTLLLDPGDVVLRARAGQGLAADQEHRRVVDE